MSARSTVWDWQKVTAVAAWQPRDSMARAVFKNRIWILGGWFDSYQPCPRDIWSSADGAHWDLVRAEAPWKHSDLSMSLAFADKLWLMGGWFNGRLPDGEAGNEVWASSDGSDWEQMTPAAGWSPRLGAGAVVFKNRMWILGGLENYYSGTGKNLRNDVWSSPDGVRWHQQCAEAPWSPRAFHQAVVFEDKIWVLGGGNYVPEYRASSDVWSSEDGVHWTEVTAAAPWCARLWFSSLVYRNCLWVLGGWTKEPFQDLNDVWYSRDGRNWNQLPSGTIWTPRHEHAAYVLHGKMWVAGGLARPLSNEVWSLELPEDSFP